MGNPYPAEIFYANALWLVGSVTFTDPANQPGSVPGAVRVLGPFPFAFNTAGIENGHTVYTPTVGDILLDAWVEIDTAFDGTTPKGDVGQFVGVNTGLWGGVNSQLDLATADSTASAGTGLLGKFTTTDPVKVVASQNGQKGGTAIGGTTGAGSVYLVVSTPSLT